MSVHRAESGRKIQRKWAQPLGDGPQKPVSSGSPREIAVSQIRFGVWKCQQNPHPLFRDPRSTWPVIALTIFSSYFYHIQHFIELVREQKNKSCFVGLFLLLLTFLTTFVLVLLWNKYKLLLLPLVSLLNCWLLKWGEFERWGITLLSCFCSPTCRNLHLGFDWLWFFLSQPSLLLLRCHWYLSSSLFHFFLLQLLRSLLQRHKQPRVWVCELRWAGVRSYLNARVEV